VSGTLGDELAVECIKEGATDYVLKDKLDRLPFAIRRALDEKRMRGDRDQAERELHQLGQHYASIVRGAPYGIYRANQDGRIIMANPALVSILGYASEAELLRLNITLDVFADRQDRGRMLSQVNEPSVFKDAEITWRRKDGRPIIVRVAGRRLEAEAGAPAVYEVFVQDITEHRVLEQQFQQAQKMEAIGRLAGGVAHDFNNLLMIIRGCAELLEHHKNQPEKFSGYLKQINDATSIAASVVQQLLMFSRKQVPERRALDFNSALRDLRKMLPRLLGEDIQIIFNPGQSLERATADRAQIEQIILNLAVNARDAMPNGGKLTIETANIHLEVPQVERRGVELPAGRYVVLAISDTGSGMDAEIQAHIFEPFFTTKERGKGTGLGLATVYGIVKESGGFISVDSATGKGSTFKIYFPCAQVSEEVPQPALPVSPAPGGSETILLVEDEEALREITCEYLQSRGYRVLTASSGMHALEICRTHEEPIDILLTDIIMPGIRGPELVKAALDMRPQMRIIYVSGYADRGIEDGSLERDAVFLRKPYSLAELGHKIRTAASGQSVHANS
jgi:PAS domain S-box-containing protein